MTSYAETAELVADGFKPLITKEGLKRAVHSNNDGVDFQITHISFGDQKFTPTGLEKALPNERLKKPIVKSVRVDNNTFRVTTIVTNPAPFVCQSVGFWSGNTLFAVYSNENLSQDGLFYVYPSIEVAVNFTLSLAALGAENITIVLDKDASRLEHLIQQSENRIIEFVNKKDQAIEG